MEVFLARQPIFDRQQKVYAYELLYRSGGKNNFYDGSDGDQATSTVLTHFLGQEKSIEHRFTC